MKNVLCVLLVCMLSLSACKSDDDTFLGTYKLTLLAQSNCNDSSENFELDFGEEECATTGGVEFCESGIYTFSADGTIISTVIVSSPLLGEIADFSSTGTYERNGNQLSICTPICEDFTINGNSMTLSENLDDCTVTFTLTKI